MEKKEIIITADEVKAYVFCSKKWDFDKIIKVLQLYKKGVSISDISVKTMRSEDKIKSILQEYKFI